MEINIFSLIWFIITYYVGYLIVYQIISSGLKHFNIENIPEIKVKIYVIISLIINLIFNSTIYPLVVLFLMAIPNKILIVFIGSIGSALITFLIAFTFFKYYFLLSDKKLWQLALYVASINLIILLVINGLMAML